MAISSQSRDIKFQAETFINLIHILSQAWNFDKSSPVKSESEMNMNKTTNGQTDLFYFTRIRILQAQFR